MTLSSEIEEAIWRLPTQERARLALRLMDSLSSSSAEDEEILREAEERDAELENGVVKSLTYEEFLSGLDSPHAP